MAALQQGVEAISTEFGSRDVELSSMKLAAKAPNKFGSLILTTHLRALVMANFFVLYNWIEFSDLQAEVNSFACELSMLHSKCQPFFTVSIGLP